MKKTFLFLFAAVFAASVNAQFVVDASGNAAVGCLTKHNYIPFCIETGRFSCTNEIVSLYLQNQNYKGNDFYYGGLGEIRDIYIGNQVDIENENGNIVVDSCATVELYATNRIVISTGFECKKGGHLFINNIIGE